jgi:spore coat polysaccharide biosynthesis protein SpsF
MLAILQARMSSARLPGKVLKPILGRPMLARQIERIRDSREISELVVATSNRASDDAIENLCRELCVRCYRGSLDDVLDRFYQAAKPYAPEAVVRLTGDCPLIDPDVIDRTIGFYLSGDYDYVSNVLQPSFPDGLDVEVCRFSALARAWREAGLKSQREHVTLFLYQHPELFRAGSYQETPDRSHLCWTVDEAVDLEVVRTIYSALYPDNPRFRMRDILQLLESHPELGQPTAMRRRNEGLAKSLREDAFCQTETRCQ